MKIRLEVGKSYILGNGDKIKVLHECKKPLAEGYRMICLYTYQSGLELEKSHNCDEHGVWNDGSSMENNVLEEIVEEDS